MRGLGSFSLAKKMFRRFTGMLALLLPAVLNAQDVNVQNVNVQSQAPAAAHEFHGTYEELSPAQR